MTMPSVRPATTRKSITASTMAPILEVETPERLGSRVVAGIDQGAGHRQAAGTGERDAGQLEQAMRHDEAEELTETSRSPFQRTKNAQDGAVVGQSEACQQAEGESACHGENGHFDVVHEDLHRESGTPHDRDSVKGAPPRMRRGVEARREQARSGGWLGKSPKRPERHETEKDAGRDHQAAVQLTNPAPNSHAQEPPGGVITSWLGIDNGVRVRHECLQAKRS